MLQCPLVFHVRAGDGRGRLVLLRDAVVVHVRTCGFRYWRAMRSVGGARCDSSGFLAQARSSVRIDVASGAGVGTGAKAEAELLHGKVWRSPYLQFLKIFSPKSLCTMDILRRIKFHCSKLPAGSYRKKNSSDLTITWMFTWAIGLLLLLN
jgi:hypothetical protein